MDKINYSEVLFQSIDQIVEERLKQVQYDRTIACEILEAHPEENLYWVNCEGLKIQVSSIDPKKTYSENTLVYVLVPNGNYENTKVIIGGYSAKDIEKKTYNNSYDNFIPNKTFYVIDENNPIVLSVKNLKVQETDAISYSPIQYNREYDYVGVHWSMQTYQLFDANITSGQYTLEIVFGNQTDDAIVSYPIHSSSIYGNPYSLSEDFEQYTLFPYSDKLNTCTHFKIRLYQGIKDETNPENRIDKFNYTGTDNPEIILCSLDLSVGYANTDFTEEQSLSIGKYESLNYKLNDSNSLERTLYFDWRIVDKNKENQIFNYNNSNFHDFINNAHIYWLQYQENEGYQSFEKLQNINFDYANIEGLYNWKIINNNNFKLSVDIDTDYQTDQYKIFIVYDHWITITDEQGNEIQTQYFDYAFTNTIIFENLDIAPIQPGAATADKPNSLKLTFNDGNTGVYNVYGLDGRMVESSKQGPYSITASLYDSLRDKIDTVEWIFPSTNTMIVDARDDGWDNLENDKKLTVKYKIKTQYYSSATSNIIQCKITMTTGEIRNANVSLQFGEVGNQGTNYAFNIDFIDKDYLTHGQTDEEIQVKATLSNQNGEEVLLEDFIDKLEWSWLFVENPNIITNKPDSATNIISISNMICSKYENNIVKLKLGDDFDFTQANYSILQAKLAGYNTGDNIQTDLLTYLCVPVAAADTTTIKPRSMQGAARVVYDSLGTATTYSKEAYELINEDNTQVADLTWELCTDTKYSGLPALTESKVKKQNTEEYIIKYKIKPSSYVPPKIPPVSIIAKKNGTSYWSQPILITQNTWFNESINEWTNVLSINQQNDGTILAPLLIAGTKNFDNLFSGVTVGQLAIGSKKVNGVYGFAQGKARFWLNEDAEFYVGDSKDKNIHLDANGNFSIVAKSFDFRTSDEIQNKLILSSTNQEFQIGNENSNSYLRFYTPEGESQKKFEIKTNDLEFNSTNYNGFSMRVGKEGFYTGTADEYISFEKENGSYYRILKIKAKKFDFSNNTIGLQITDQGLTIGKIADASNYINLDSTGTLTMNLDNFAINTNDFNLTADNIAISSNNNGYFSIGNDDNYLLFDGSNFSLVSETFDLRTSNMWINSDYQQIEIRNSSNDIVMELGKLYSWGYQNQYGVAIKDGAFVLMDSNSKKKIWFNSDSTILCLDGRITNADYSNSYLTIGVNDNGYPGVFYDYNSVNYFKIWPNAGGNCVISGKNGIIITNTDNNNTIAKFTSNDGTLLRSVSSMGLVNDKTFFSKGAGYNEAALYFSNYFCCYSVNSGTVDSFNYQHWDNNWGIFNLTADGGRTYGTWDLYGTQNFRGNPQFYSGPGFYDANNKVCGWISARLTNNGTPVYNKIQITASSGCTGFISGTWSASNDLSDSRIKNSIEELSEQYELLFDNLRPCRYKYNNGTSGRYHTGYIAQDIVEAIENKTELTTQDFAGIMLYPNFEYDYVNSESIWALRRDEFISLNTWQIQKLKARVVELENEIKEIKQRYEI